VAVETQGVGLGVTIGFVIGLVGGFGTVTDVDFETDTGVTHKPKLPG
jgi:hypothetical protein